MLAQQSIYIAFSLFILLRLTVGAPAHQTAPRDNSNNLSQNNTESISLDTTSQDMPLDTLQNISLDTTRVTIKVTSQTAFRGRPFDVDWTPSAGQTVFIEVIPYGIRHSFVQLAPSETRGRLYELRMSDRTPLNTNRVERLFVDYFDEKSDAILQIVYGKRVEDEFHHFVSLRGIFLSTSGKQYYVTMDSEGSVVEKMANAGNTDFSAVQNNTVSIVVKPGFVTDRIDLNVYFSEKPESRITSEFIVRKHPLVLTEEALSCRRKTLSAPLTSLRAGVVLDTLTCLLSARTLTNRRCVSRATSGKEADTTAIIKVEQLMLQVSWIPQALAKAGEDNQDVDNSDDSVVKRALEITDIPFINGMIVTLTCSFLLCILIRIKGKGKKTPPRTRKPKQLQEEQRKQQQQQQQHTQHPRQLPEQDTPEKPLKQLSTKQSQKYNSGEDTDGGIIPAQPNERQMYYYQTQPDTDTSLNISRRGRDDSTNFKDSDGSHS